MKLAKNPDIAKWHCSRCDTWNGIDLGTCKNCGSPVQIIADAFRLRDTLSSDEKAYYETVVPMLMREVKGIHHEVREMRESVIKMVESMEKSRAMLREMFPEKAKEVSEEEQERIKDEIKQMRIQF